jgi:hypothetical protein
LPQALLREPFLAESYEVLAGASRTMSQARPVAELYGAMAIFDADRPKHLLEWILLGEAIDRYPSLVQLTKRDTTLIEKSWMPQVGQISHVFLNLFICRYWKED